MRLAAVVRRPFPIVFVVDPATYASHAWHRLQMVLGTAVAPLGPALEQYVMEVSMAGVVPALEELGVEFPEAADKWTISAISGDPTPPPTVLFPPTMMPPPLVDVAAAAVGVTVATAT